jgi:hypothetical protein
MREDVGFFTLAGSRLKRYFVKSELIRGWGFDIRSQYKKPVFNGKNLKAGRMENPTEWHDSTQMFPIPTCFAK